ncbi:hypothetical protein D3C73_1059660 [compost metagenome]
MLITQVIGLQRNLLHWVGTFQAQLATRARPQGAGVDRDTVATGWQPVDIADQRRHHMKLHVRPTATGGIDESTALHHVGAKQTRTVGQVLETVPQRTQAPVMPEQADRFTCLRIHRSAEVILKVLTHARRVHAHCNAHFIQMSLRPNPRQHQKFG